MAQRPAKQSVDVALCYSAVGFALAGSSDVYATGYRTTSSMMPGDYPYFDGEDTSDEEEEEEEDDDDQPPQAVPLNSKRKAALIAVRPILNS